MNTVSSTVTFIMVFLLQRSQNKDTKAMQIKLNEIIAALEGANNSLINIENLSEKEIIELQRRHESIAANIKVTGEHLNDSLSIDELAKEIEIGLEEKKD